MPPIFSAEYSADLEAAQKTLARFQLRLEAEGLEWAGADVLTALATALTAVSAVSAAVAEAETTYGGHPTHSWEGWAE